MVTNTLTNILWHSFIKCYHSLLLYYSTLIRSDYLSWEMHFQKGSTRGHWEASQPPFCSITRPLEQNNRCNKDTCDNNSLQLKFIQSVSPVRPSDGPGLSAASSVSSQHNCFAGSQQHHSDPPPFTGKRDTDKLLLCSFTTLQTWKQPIRDLIHKVAFSVCDLTCPGPHLWRGSLPWNLFEVIVPCSSLLCSRPSSQQVVTVRNYL